MTVPTIKLSETTKFIVDNRGKTVPTADTGIPLIATNCIDNRNLYPVYEKLRYVSQETYDNWFRSHPKPMDIILTLKGSQNGAVNLVPDPVDFCIAQDMVALRVDEEKIDPLYLFAALRSEDIQDQIKTLDVSGVIPHFKKSDFDKLVIPLPSRALQQFIGKNYYNLCQKIDLLHRQNKTLEAIAETLFRQCFIEEAKEDWEEATLEHHIVAIKGLSYKGSGLCEIGQGVPMFNLNSVLEGGGYKTTGLKYYKGDYKERHIVKAGDIIVANTEQGHEHRLIGFPATIPSYFSGESIFTHHIFKVSLLEDTYLSNPFVYYLLCSSAVREQITGATNGSTVNQLAADGLQRPKFKLPPKNLVESFTDQATSFWEKRDLNQQQIWSLEKIRDTLLPKLMSGEVRVQFKQESAA